MKQLFLILLIVQAISVSAQKTMINRKVAQKNYDGYMLMLDSNYTEAIKFFDQAIADDPEAFFVYQNRAICRLNLHDTTGAISDFKMNIKLDPKNTESYYALGNVYKYRNDTALTSEYFEGAIKLAGSDYDSVKLAYMHQFLGNSDFDGGNYAEAVDHFDIITEYYPGKSVYYLKKAVSYHFLDSLEKSCDNLKLAYIYGESVPCRIMDYLCHSCNETKSQRKKYPKDTLIVDKLLEPLLEDYKPSGSGKTPDFEFDEATFKIRYNKNWEICADENMEFYRKSLWATQANFYTGAFCDYYKNDTLLANGYYFRSKLHGVYNQFYQSGHKKITGEFVNGEPVKNWYFFYEDGASWMEVYFENGSFMIQSIKDRSGNYAVKDGTGQVLIEFKTAEGGPMILSGQLVDYKMDGDWTLAFNNEPLVAETYKKTVFKKGVVFDGKKKLRTNRSFLTGWIFVPAYLNQISTLEFESENIKLNYPFMAK